MLDKFNKFFFITKICKTDLKNKKKIIITKQSKHLIESWKFVEQHKKHVTFISIHMIDYIWIFKSRKRKLYQYGLKGDMERKTPRKFKDGSFMGPFYQYEYKEE